MLLFPNLQKKTKKDAIDSDPRMWKLSTVLLSNLQNIGISLPKLKKSEKKLSMTQKSIQKRKRLIRLLQTETTDETLYRKALDKALYIARVERLLKEYAVDCTFNRPMNIYRPKEDNEIILYTSQKQKIKYKIGDRDYSEECDYDVCNYSCKPESELKKVKQLPIDKSTYQINFSKNVIDMIKQYIRLLFTLDYKYSLEDIVEYVKQAPRYFSTRLSKENLLIYDTKNIEEKNIYIVLNNFIDNGEIIFDRFDRSGYIIYRDGVLYIPTL